MDELTKKSLPNIFQKDSYCLLLLSAFIVLLVLPIFFFGIPNGFDLPFHYQLANTYFESIQSGNFFPSWSLLSNNGLGDTALRYYPPLAHYLLALTQILANDWSLSFWLNIFFWMWLGSIGAFLFSREWLSPLNSFLVGILYAVAPYHLSQIYQYFLYSEFAAAAVLPFCFLYLTKIFRDNKLKNVVGLGISFAFLILCHIPTTIISTICLSIFAILIIDWKKFWFILSKLILSGLIVLSATSFYLVRLILESGFSNQSNPKQFTGLYYYKIHFFPFFLSQPDVYIIKQLWLKDIIAFLTLMLFLPFLGYLLFGIKKFDSAENKFLTALGGSALFAFFMSSLPSNFLWSVFPFLQKLQFPFRWLTVASLLGVLGFVFLLSYFQFVKKAAIFTKKYLIIVFLIILSIFDITQVILPSEALTKSNFENKMQEIQTEQVLEATRTIWAKDSAFDQKEKVTAQDRRVKIIGWQSEKREFEIESGEATMAQIAVFYYPYWQATVNDNPVSIEKSDNGLVIIPVPNQESKIKLTFNEPPIYHLFNIISFLTWAMLTIIGFKYYFSKGWKLFYSLKRMSENPTINV